MSKRDKILIALALLCVILLATITFAISNKIATIENSMYQIAKQAQLKQSVIKGIDGKDGESIIGETGKPGKDSVSTIETKTIVEQVPLQGKDGANGKDAENKPTQETRYDKETGTVQTKLSDWDIWYTMIPCENLVNSCPTTAKPAEEL